MRTVQKSDLSLMIWSLAWNEEDVQSCLVCRELCSYRLRSLDHPEMEDLALYDKIVLIADALMDLVDRILRISRHDAVNEGAVYTACLFEPCLESVSEIPEIDVLVDALLELLSVQEDELARKDYESLGHIAAEMLVSAVKKLGKLARI